MKLYALLPATATVALGAFALGLAVNALALPAFAVAAGILFSLIVAHDYAPRRRDYAAASVAGARERLPYAA